MSGDDVTTGILRQIRDEIVKTNERLEGTNERLDSVNQRLDSVNERLDGTNQRLDVVETTLQDLAAQQLMLTRYVGNVVDRH